MTPGLVVLLIPLLIYLFFGLRLPKGQLQTPNDFFLAKRQVRTMPFSNSSIAYGFQVATVFPFLMWGAWKVLLVPIANAIFWGVGILLFAWALPRLRDFLGKDYTLHRFLSEKYGGSISIRFATSLVTVIAMWGVILAEIIWGSQVITAIVPKSDFFYIAIFLMAFYVLVYVSYGGQPSSILTDQSQLVFSYVGVFGLLTVLMILGGTGHVPVDPVGWIGAIFFFIVVIGVFLLRRFRFLEKGSGRIASLQNLLLCASLVAFLAGCGAYAFRAPTNWGTTDLGVFRKPGDYFGWPGLVAMILLPISYQFVDMTGWQRILSVRNADGEAPPVREIRRGVFLYALESPLTWLSMLLLGIVAVAAGLMPDVENPLVSLSKSLIASNPVGMKLLGYLFIISVLSIMLSTVDSVIVATMFAFSYDLYPKTRRQIDAAGGDAREILQPVLRSGRFFGATLVIAGLAVFTVLDTSGLGGDKFIGILFAFYGAQLSFCPAVLGALFLSRRPGVLVTGASIVLGALSGLIFGLGGTFLKPSLQWWGVISALVVSTIVYVIGLALPKRQYAQAEGGPR